MCNDLNQTLLTTLDPKVANKLIDDHIFCIGAGGIVIVTFFIATTVMFFYAIKED